MFDFGVENHKDVLQHLVTESKKYILEFKYFVQKKWEKKLKPGCQKKDKLYLEFTIFSK